MPVVICPVSYLCLYFPIFRRCRTDVHQNNTRIRLLLTYSTSRRSRRQGIKERRLRRGACNVRTACECFQNCNSEEHEEQLAIIGPTLICKNHVINHTTYGDMIHIQIRILVCTYVWWERCCTHEWSRFRNFTQRTPAFQYQISPTLLYPVQQMQSCTIGKGEKRRHKWHELQVLLRTKTMPHAQRASMPFLPTSSVYKQQGLQALLKTKSIPLIELPRHFWRHR